MNEKPIDAVVAGHICLDVIPGFEAGREYRLNEVVVPGRLTAIHGAKLSTGGPVSNTGLPMLKLGADVRLMGKVGDDFFGDGIISLLAEHDAHTGMTVAKGERTSYTIVIAPPGVDRCFLHDPGANDTFECSDINFGLVERARLFHFGYPPLMARMYADNGRELARIFREAKRTGVTTSLDMAFVDPDSPSGKADWRTILADVLPNVDLFLPSAEETMYMLDRERFLSLQKEADSGDVLDLISSGDISAMAGELMRMGAGAVALKCGVKGLYIRTGSASAFEDMGRARPEDLDDWHDRELWEPSFRVTNIAGTTGSGDCTIAGMLCAFLKGESIESCIRYACAVGGHNVMAPDAVSGVKSWAETSDDIRKGWAKNKLDPGDGWSCQEQEQHWVGPNDRSSNGGR